MLCLSRQKARVEMIVRRAGSDARRTVARGIAAAQELRAVRIAPCVLVAMRSRHIMGMATILRSPSMVQYRLLSTAGDKTEGTSKADAGSKAQQQTQQEAQQEAEYEVPQERIGFMRGLGYLTVAGVAVVSLYYIAKELFPSRSSPNHLFNEAFDAVKANYDVVSRYGEPLKGYGRDAGARREGRRNFIEHKEYKGEDGSDRMRIRFNIEGPYGHAFVFAEVSKGMKKGEWVYLLVQDLASGRVQTIEDNRAALAAKTPQERAAIEALVKGGGGTQ